MKLPLTSFFYLVVGMNEPHGRAILQVSLEWNVFPILGIPQRGITGGLSALRTNWIAEGFHEMRKIENHWSLLCGPTLTSQLSPW